MIKAVLFDMDGVVLDTEKLYTRFWKQAVEECGFHMTWEQLLGLRSLGQEYADAYFKGILGPNAREDTIRQIRRVRMKEYTDQYGIEKKPGIDETLRGLKERGIPAVIATASQPSRAKQFLNEVGLASAFDRILTSAWRAGCRVIMVPDLSQPDEKLKEKLSAVAKDLTGILPYIDQWNNEK